MGISDVTPGGHHERRGTPARMRRAARPVLAGACVLGLLAVSACGLNGGRPRGQAVGQSGFGNADAPAGNGNSVIFLHHSTGNVIWEGGVADAVNSLNNANGTQIAIKEQNYPYKPHAWSNDPYDYWNLWVNHSGSNRLQEQPTLEQIAADFDVIVWKDCYTTAGMVANDGSPRADSDAKTLANYKLQYNALKAKMNSMPERKFIVWTTPPKANGDTNAEAAKLTTQFVSWVKKDWDVPGDNIFLWDYNALAMEGSTDGLFPRSGYSVSDTDSHPSKETAKAAAPRMAQRIFDVVAGKGDSTAITG